MRNSTRCLFCGGQLAFLSKFTSGTFCSPEHRDEYHGRLDRVIAARLKDEKRRLVERGSIAPAPLAQLLRRGPQWISPPGITRATAVPADLGGYVAVPQQATSLATRLAEGPYLDGLCARRNSGIKNVDCESRVMRRQWPKAPRLTRAATATLVLPHAHANAAGPVAPRTIVIDAQPVRFSRPWNLKSNAIAPVCRIGRAEQRLQVIAPRVRANAPANLGISHDAHVFQRTARMPQMKLGIDTELMSAVWSRSTVEASGVRMPVDEIVPAEFVRRVQICGQLRALKLTSAEIISVRPPARVPYGFQGVIVGGQPETFSCALLLPRSRKLAHSCEVGRVANAIPSSPLRAVAKRIEIVVDPRQEPFTGAAVLPFAGATLSGALAAILQLPWPSVVTSGRVRLPHVSMAAMRLRPLMPLSRLTTSGFGKRRGVPETGEVPASLWQRIPASWKRVSVGLPIVGVLMAVYLTTGRSNISQVRAETSMIQQVMGDMKRDLGDRAAVDLTDTFASDLNQWNGADKWRDSWTVNTTGAVPGKLALLSASVPLRDYNAEFTAQIVNKAFSFAVRARDLDNYYAVRFVVVTPGLMPEVVMERYRVVGGDKSAEVRTPIHLPLAHDSLYRVRVELKDQNVTVYLNDTVADSWSDARFPSGGIGFFAKKGEKARITGLHIWHQDDTVGRLLAHLSRDDEKRAR